MRLSATMMVMIAGSMLPMRYGLAQGESGQQTASQDKNTKNAKHKKKSTPATATNEGPIPQQQASDGNSKEKPQQGSTGDAHQRPRTDPTPRAAPPDKL